MQTGAEVQAHVMLKASEDVGFRERLIADPKGVIEAETGKQLPDSALVFINQAIENGTEPAVADQPLSVDELTAVIGGDCDGGIDETWGDCTDDAAQGYE